MASMSDDEYKALFGSVFGNHKKEELRVAAETLFGFYTSLKVAGFTDEQAMQILVEIMKGKK